MMPTSTERVRVGPQGLPGMLDMPADAAALVLCTHGGGNSALSTSKRQVAQVLSGYRVGTLLLDLPGAVKAAGWEGPQDISSLAARIGQALDWVAGQRALAAMPIGFFGAGIGAAAALATVAERPGRVAAVVSFGGRLDLAAHCLERVDAPIMLIVGDADRAVVEINRAALRMLACNKRLEVLPGAAHLFQEPGTLDSVAELAAAWFTSHLVHRRFM